jgi:transcription elongation factor GreA
MIDDTRSRPSPAGAVILSSADLAQATRELEALRSEHRDDPDELHVRISHLERLVASATVVEVCTEPDGSARLGSFVRVRDDAGKETEYELVGRRGEGAPATQVTPASPVGEALLGARAGDRVQVELPSGRRRPLTVVALR